MLLGCTNGKPSQGSGDPAFASSMKAGWGCEVPPPVKCMGQSCLMTARELVLCPSTVCPSNRVERGNHGLTFSRVAIR